MRALASYKSTEMGVLRSILHKPDRRPYSGPITGPVRYVVRFSIQNRFLVCSGICLEAKVWIGVKHTPICSPNNVCCVCEDYSLMCLFCAKLFYFEAPLDYSLQIHQVILTFYPFSPHIYEWVQVCFSFKASHIAFGAMVLCVIWRNFDI